jgi:hypothetical protein
MEIPGQFSPEIDTDRKRRIHGSDLGHLSWLTAISISYIRSKIGMLSADVPTKN